MKSSPFCFLLIPFFLEFFCRVLRLLNGLFYSYSLPLFIDFGLYMNHWSTIISFTHNLPFVTLLSFIASFSPTSTPRMLSYYWTEVDKMKECVILIGWPITNWPWELKGSFPKLGKEGREEILCLSPYEASTFIP